MADFSQWWWQAAAGPGPGPGPGPDPGDPIGQSLRFRNENAFLENTSITCPSTFTYSGWVKLGKIKPTPWVTLFCQIDDASGGIGPQLGFQTANKLQYYTTSGDLQLGTALYRDPSAWYHVVGRQTLTGFTAWINGQVALSSTQTISGTSGPFQIHASFSGTNWPDTDCYQAAVYFIDGQELEPTTFGRYNSQGVWVPVDPQGLTYGSNGFKLTLEDPSDIGKDYSGNGNDFTAIGFETADTSSPDYDVMQDSPTQNYATINSLYPGASTTKANLNTANTTGKPTILGIAGDVGVEGASVAWDGTEAGWNSTGHINFGQQPGGFDEFSTRTMPAAPIPDGRDHFQAITGLGQGPATPGANQRLGAFSPYITVTAGPSFPNWDDGNSANAFDGATNTFAGTGSTGSWRFAPDTAIAVTTSVSVFSFSTAGTVSWNGQTGNLNGGWVTLTAAGNVSSSTPISATTVGAGQSCFVCAIRVDGDVLVDGSILAIAQQTFPNGLWWIKDRANINQHQLVDSVNGTSAVITSPAGSITAYAAPTGSSVAWCWNAANTDAGFSITNGTHGLGTTPAMVIDRALNVWHQSLPDGQGLVLKTNATSSPQAWTIDGTTVSGPGGGSYYSWAEISGYSSFGSYTGTEQADGPFIYTGHSVSFLLIKRLAADSWHIFDATRSPYNSAGKTSLKADMPNPEDDTFNNVDFLSNGFKLKSTNSATNGLTEHIYAAFAKNPFQAPATAR